MSDFEAKRLALEEKKLDAEIEARKAELELRTRELTTAARSFSPGTTALIAGVLSILTAGVTSWATGLWSVALQQEKNAGLLKLKKKEFQFQIVLRVTSDRTPEEASKNLLYFVDTGFLPDPTGKIRAKAEQNEAPMIRDLFSSDAAARLGLDNTPTGAAIDSLLLLKENVLDKVESQFGTPLLIASGFRSDGLNSALFLMGLARVSIFSERRRI